MLVIAADPGPQGQSDFGGTGGAAGTVAPRVWGLICKRQLCVAGPVLPGPIFFSSDAVNLDFFSSQVTL